MKRTHGRILVLLICVMALMLSVGAFLYSRRKTVKTYTIESRGSVLQVVENGVTGTDTYETTYKQDDAEIRSIWTIDHTDHTVSLAIYEDEAVLFGRSVMIPDSIHTNAVYPDLGDSDRVYDAWLGYSYRYESLSDGRIAWELSDPNPQVSPNSKHITPLIADLDQKNAMKFADSVIEIKTAVEKLTATLDDTAILVIKTLLIPASEAIYWVPSNETTAFQTAYDLSLDDMSTLRTMFHAALMADSYYLDIK